MNKTEFTNELKELMSTMSEEEIRKTINALNGCRSSVSRKQNRENSEKSRLFLTSERREAELYYLGEGKLEGVIVTVGASLLTSTDYTRLREELAGGDCFCGGNWWLFDHYRITSGNICAPKDSTTTGKIRPVLLIERIGGNLKPGDCFHVNYDRFKLLTPSLAIRVDCLPDSCTFLGDEYPLSLPRFCVDGWYGKLIRENELQRQESDATKTGRDESYTQSEQ